MTKLCVETLERIARVEPSPVVEFIEYVDRGLFHSLARTYRFRGLHQLKSKDIKNCSLDISKAVEIYWGVKISLPQNEKEGPQSFEEFLDTLYKILLALNVVFTYDEKNISYSKVFSPTGFLPSIERRAEQLLQLTARRRLGITFEEAEGSLVGTKITFEKDISWTVRLFPTLVVLLDLCKDTRQYELSLVVALDSLKYD